MRENNADSDQALHRWDFGEGVNMAGSEFCNQERGLVARDCESCLNVTKIIAVVAVMQVSRRSR